MEIPKKPQRPTRPTYAMPSEISNSYRSLIKIKYFAGLAMQGILSNPSEGRNFDYEHVAQKSYECAAALLKELSKNDNKPQ